MTQYNFGTIDPYVVDGVQLAGMLNQWRDAIHSLHRGPSRPSYAVPGMLWVDDSGGSTNWRIKMYLGGTIDAAMFSFNTTTGVTTAIFAAGGTFSAGALSLQSTAPELGIFKTDNGVDLKRWAFSMDSTGRLILNALTDGGGATGTQFLFNRDGTFTGKRVNPSFRLRPTTQDILSGPNTLNMFRSQTTPVEDFDTGSNVAINAAGARFTTAVAAKWQFESSIHITTATQTNVQPIIKHITSGGATIRDYFTMGTVFAGIADGVYTSALIDLAAGEGVEFYWQVVAAASVTLQPGSSASTGSFASGHKVSD